MNESTLTRRSYQVRLMDLRDGFDSNGHYYQWFGWNGAELSKKTYKRELVAGSDGYQDGVGCPVRMLSDEAYYLLYAEHLDWLFSER